LHKLLSKIDPDELLLAYQLGIFPMAENRHAEDVLWIRPRVRGILPLRRFHVPRRLARTIRSDRYEVRIDTAFGAVIRGCASVDPNEGVPRERGDTWINKAIIDVFETLHARGQAHSVECWEKGELVGGLYGLSLGAAFFAESKFSRRTDASKVALVHLAARLKYGGYTLLDAQFPNPHLTQFGAITVDEQRCGELLDDALARSGNFYSFGARAGGASAPAAASAAAASASSSSTTSGASVLQVITQTS
jgi:leucyl/phenylalanyl-tRNA--protein transferase